MSGITKLFQLMLDRAAQLHQLSKPALNIIERDNNLPKGSLKLQHIPETGQTAIIKASDVDSGTNMGVVGSPMWEDATSRVNTEALFEKLGVKNVPATAPLPLEDNPYKGQFKPK